MRKISLIVGFAFATSVAFMPAQAAPRMISPDEVAGEPDATVDFEASQMRLILGGSSGKGTLHYQGKDHTFTMKGGSIGGVGVSSVEGTGLVYKMKKLSDFAGNYTGVGIGAALVKGSGASTFQNSKGVVVSTKVKTTGVAMNLGMGGVVVKLDKQ